MRIVGIGVDLLRIGRINELCHRRGGPLRLLNKICNTKEIEACLLKTSNYNISNPMDSLNCPNNIDGTFYQTLTSVSPSL